MIAALRRNKVKEIIWENGSAKAEDLARQFNVSEETIRRDFTWLEKAGFVQKNYGGATAKQESRRMMENISPVQQRKSLNYKEKRRIGEAAAQLVRPGMGIYLDSGSTVWTMIQYMNEAERLTIITNSLDIARECAERVNWTVITLGGQVIPKSMSTVGPNLDMQLMNFSVDVAFLGTTGISARGECTSANLFESNLKKQVVESAQKVVLLADSSKLGVNAMFTFVKLQQLHTLISSDRVRADIRDLLAEAGVDLIAVEAEG